MIRDMNDSWLAKAEERALELVHEAGQLALQATGPGPLQLKPDASVVTEVDLAVQRLVTQRLAAAYPDHAQIAEEHLPDAPDLPGPADARYCWVLDPIDGTRNFSLGYPCYATSLALLDDGAPVLGVVREHNLGWQAVAQRGAGVTVQGIPAQVRDLQAGLDWLLGIPSGKDDVSLGVIRTWMTMRDVALRNTGSSAMNMALVAAGGLQGTFAQRCKIWDVAAGVLLVLEAGGQVWVAGQLPFERFDLTRDPQADLPCLAGSPQAFARLLPAVLECTRQAQ